MLPSATDLVYFQAVATQGHISRAAIKLNISQPSISMAIKRLEDLLGCSLFIRHKQGVTLTRAGNALLSDVNELLGKWQQIKTNIHAAEFDVKGHVTIGCNSALAAFFSGRVATLLTTYPGLEIHLKHETNDSVLDDIVQAKLDIAVVIDPYPHADIIIKKIADVEFTLWSAKNREGTINLATDDYAVICHPDFEFSQHLIRALQEIRHKPLRLSTSSQLEAVAAMTVSDCGIGILPSCFAGRYFKDQLSKVADAPVYQAAMCLTYRQESKNVAAINTVLDELKSYIQAEFGQSGTS